MEPAIEAATRFAKQVIDFQRTMFENVFKSMVMFQDQTESATSTLLKQATWLPKEGRDTINEWVKACKKGREDYKKMIDEGFDNMEKFFPKV